MDKDNSGQLSYQEFRESFKTLSYGLNENDINMLIALADENKDEKINWKEFIDIGIEAIKTFYSRNIAKKKAEKMQNPEPSALKLVLWDEIMHTYKLLTYKFMAADKVEDGVIPL
jgi:hypothetical protein